MRALPTIPLAALLSCCALATPASRQARYEHAYCERLVRCGSASLLGAASFETVEICLQVRGNSPGPTFRDLVDAALATDRVRFDDDAFERYLDELASGRCDQVPEDGPLRGLGEDGAACTRSFECRSGACDGCPGVCTRAPAVGDPCGEADLLGCGLALRCLAGLCVERPRDLGEGEACDTEVGLAAAIGNPCAAGLFCDPRSSLCQPFADEGEPAPLPDGVFVGCAPGLRVDAEGLCQRPVFASDEGAPCDGALLLCSAASGLTCRWEPPGGGLCRRAPRTSEVCEAFASSGEMEWFQDCDAREPLFCDAAGLCEVYRGPGEPCSQHSECESRYCDADTAACGEIDLLACRETAGGP